LAALPSAQRRARRWLAAKQDSLNAFMKINFACPRCERSGRAEMAAGAGALVCPHCGLELAIPPAAIENGELHHCLACPSVDLFIRKDFPQRLGVTIVILGFAISCFMWWNYWLYATFGVLFATALIDVLLFALVGDALVCYRCGAEYRQLESMAAHGPFNLDTHERYRQQAARLSQTAALQPTAASQGATAPKATAHTSVSGERSASAGR